MENEIKVGDWIRLNDGTVGKYQINKNWINVVETNDKYIGFDIEKDIVKHSNNLIDIIEVGDYVNGYKVTNVINKEPCPSGKCVDIDADRPSEYCTLWEDNIETIVTKEQFESITYKVTKM